LIHFYKRSLLAHKVYKERSIKTFLGLCDDISARQRRADFLWNYWVARSLVSVSFRH